jgi:hypothetical protein
MSVYIDFLGYILAKRVSSINYKYCYFVPSLLERGMNREAAPLIVGLLLPVIFVASVVLYLSGYDIIAFFRKINIIYYLLILPFGLGLLVIILWFRKPRD